MENLINSGVGAALGLALQKHNDRRQLKQQQALGEQQLGLDIRKLDYATQKELEMWEKTGFQGQMQQLKKAGLNPSLLYGMGGAGGATMGVGSAGVAAPNAPTGGGEFMGMMLQKAQVEMMKAQTEKTKAEAQKISGVDTNLAQTQIQDLTQGIENKKALEKLTNIQANIAELEQLIKEGSYDDVIDTLRYTARKAGVELEILRNDKTISDETMKNKIEIVEAELLGLGIANELKRAQVGLTKEQIEKTKADVAQGWKSLNIQEKNAIANLMSSEAAKENASTNLHEFMERARNNQFGNQIAKESLELQKFLNNVSKGTELTVKTIMDVLYLMKRKGAVIR